MVAPNSFSHDCMYSPSSWHNFQSVLEALACASSKFCCILFEKCSSLLLLLSFFSEFLQCVLEDAYLSVLLSFVDRGDFFILKSSDSLLTLSLQILFQMCVFFLSRLIPTHPSRGRSLFHLPWGFELCHLSCEPASSAAADRKCGFDLEYHL